MKTPREILLTRHEAAEPKLDTLREKVLATVKPRPKQTWRFEEFVNRARNLLRVPRFAWIGLAAAWLVIIALQFSARDSTSIPSAAFTQRQPPTETLQAVREQKRLLAELTGLIEKPEGEAPRFVPRPRTERRRELVMV